MDLATTRAWILLAVPDAQALLPQIIGRADGLNKAIPTHQELSESLGWLRTADLVHCDGDSYGRTPAGCELVESCSNGCSNAFDIWDNVANELTKREIVNFELADLSEDQVQAAYESYSKEFWDKYNELSAKDS